MRRRSKTERRPDVTSRPDVASVQKKMASLPLKVSAATQTNECHATTDECHAMAAGCHTTTDGCHATTGECHDMTDECHEMTDGCHAMADGCHMLTQECYDMTSRSPVEFPKVHGSSSSSSGRLDRSSSSCCSCPDCLLSLPTSDLGLEDAADCHLFVFEDDFERLSEAEYQVDDDDDDDADADQFIEFCFEETSRYLDEISHGSKDDRHHPDLRLELPPPLLFPSAPGKIASGIRKDSVGDMALVETGSSHNDSGIGRTTDESVKADDSSEQEMLENYFQPYRFHHSSGGNLSSAALAAFPLDTTTMLLNDIDASRKGMASNFCQDLGEMSRDFEQMHLQSLVTTEAQQPNQRRNAITGQVENEPSGTFLPPPTPKHRVVPRMGTRSDFCRHARGVSAAAPCHDPFPLTLPGSFGNDGEVIWVRNTDGQTNPETNSFLKMIATYQIPSDGCLRSSDRNDLTMTSAYHTGNSSCSSTPVFPQKAMNHPPTTSEHKKRPFPDGQPPSTLPPWKTKSSDVDPDAAVPTRTNTASQTTVDDYSEQTSETVPDACQLRSLQKLYTQYVDVMYTNRANLEHTIMVQQKLFSQQVQLNARKKTQRDTESKSSETQPAPHPIPASSSAADHRPCCPEDQTPMEWVVKRRSDGSRYIARRPLRNQILKDRAQRLTEERSGVTTDDDAASEMKLGRYWSRDKRKVHLERARFHRQQKEMLQRQKMETVRENDADHHQPNIIELSRRKVMRHKSKKLLDGFTTVQELLAHGNNEPFGRSSNPLLSVTTV